MSIYNEFKPTYLYIKQHSVTRKLYFGKTSRSHKQMLSYLGSGKHWTQHIKNHGIEHVVTLWYCLFYNKEDIEMFATLFSNQQNIVESKDWLNLKIEDGLAGGKYGIVSTETKQKMSTVHKGQKHGSASKQKISASNSGVNHPSYGVAKSAESKRKSSLTQKGRKKSPEHIAKIRAGMARFHKSQPLLLDLRFM